MIDSLFIISIITSNMDIFENIKDCLIVFSRALLKTVTGFVIVPLGIFIDNVKPGWEESPRTVKYLTGVILLPVTTFLYFAGPWWEDFDIVD